MEDLHAIIGILRVRKAAQNLSEADLDNPSMVIIEIGNCVAIVGISRQKESRVTILSIGKEVTKGRQHVWGHLNAPRQAAGVV